MGKSGVITVVYWTMAPNGETYLYFWFDDWMVVTDKQMPIPNFRSTEKWSLIARKEEQVIAVFPGCQVKAFVACDKSPACTRVFNLNGQSN